MKKYYIIPGYVKSKNDDEWHRITGPNLIRLYGINPKECVICSDFNPNHDNLIELGVRHNGDYKEFLRNIKMNKQSLKYVLSIVDHLITYLDGTTFDLRTQVLASDKVQVWFVIDGNKRDMKMYRVDKINNTKESMVVHQYLNEIRPKLETYKLEEYNEDR